MSHLRVLKNILLSVPLILALMVTPAAAEISLGNKGALTPGIDAQAEYDSNIAANSAEVSDTILSAMPKLLYRYDQGIVLVDAFVGMRVTEYLDESQFDSENFKSRVSLRYPKEPEFDGLSWTLTGGYNESTSADDDLQTIVERERIDAKLSLRYDIAERYYLRGGVDYFDEETKTAGFSDIESFGLPVDFFYRYSETLAFGFGVEFRDVGIDSGAGPTASGTSTSSCRGTTA